MFTDEDNLLRDEEDDYIFDENDPFLMASGIDRYHQKATAVRAAVQKTGFKLEGKHVDFLKLLAVPEVRAYLFEELEKCKVVFHWELKQLEAG